jgi:hypothetical protein
MTRILKIIGTHTLAFWAGCSLAGLFLGVTQ